MTPLLHGVRRALLGGQKLRPFDFDLALTTFTAGMAKRTGSVFAAAPIVQGKWDGTGTPDALSFVRGSQVAGNWYDNFDPYQGGGFVIWTPEQSTGDQAGDLYLWYISSNYYLKYDDANDRYELKIGGQTLTVAATVAAGTKEILAWGFDTNNKLDGTNYAYLSRNDVQTYGMPTQPTVAASDATIYIGSNGTADPANGIPEGVVFVREVPWTGAYGTDMGQGDIVAAHYAASAGADVALSIGSWGTTFSLPTNATPGALVTGTGEAWSHPHSSAVLTDSWCETTYGASAWGDEGTPSAGPADQAAGTKIFAWGYHWTCDAADEGITQTVACAAGANYVIRVIAHCVSANDIRVRIWDETNGAQIGADFDFGASSSRTAPGVALFCFEAPTIARNGVGSDCISISVKVLGTANTQEVFVHQVELQVNLIDNPSLETGAGNPWIPDGWSNSGLDAGDSSQGATTHSGLASLQFNVNAITNEYLYENSPSYVAGRFYALGAWIYGDGTKSLEKIGMQGADRGLLQYSAVAFYRTDIPVSATWSHVSMVMRALSERLRPALYLVLGATGARFADDCYTVALTAISLTATPASEANSAESGGRRVDGRDRLTQAVPVGYLAGTSGWIRWRWRPRHDAAQLAAFDESGDLAYLIYAEGVANYFGAWATAANNIRLELSDGGGVQNVNWNCAGLITADTEYLMEIRYAAGWMRLYQDGVVVAQIIGAIDFAADIPTLLNWGHSGADVRQVDAVYLNP